MNRADISYTRNHLSEMLARVNEDVSILIVERQPPVARLEPARALSASELEMVCLDRRLSEAGRKEGCVLVVRA